MDSLIGAKLLRPLDQSGAGHRAVNQVIERVAKRLARPLIIIFRRHSRRGGESASTA